MLAQKDNIFEETSETDVARYWCQMREEGERILRTYKSLMKEKDAIIAEKDSTIAALQAELEKYKK